MRYALLFAITFLGAAVLSAQNRPQLTWEGYVSSSAVLYIQGDRVDSQGRETGSVDRPSYDFAAPLPAVRQRVELDIQRGRGRVQIVEQPVPENEFTAVVRIDPPGTRPEHYVLRFYWDAGAYRSGRRADPWGARNRTNDRAASGEMSWTGEVDNEVLIEVRGRRAVPRTVRGQQVYSDNATFSSPLPRSATVELLDAQGRGPIELVEQPSPQNGDVAVVRITDPQRGAGRYSFRLAWTGGGSAGEDPYYRPRPGAGGVLSPDGYGNPAPGATANTLRWSGRVDGRIRVTVRGNRASTTVVAGRPVQGERFSFGAPLPRRELSEVDLRKVEGRDDVEIIQRPSASNGYTLVFEIHDDDGGADNYVIEISWR